MTTTTHNTVTVWYMRHDDPSVGYILNDRDDMRANYNDLEERGTFADYLDSWESLEVPRDAWHNSDDTRIKALIETHEDPGPMPTVQKHRLVDAIDWAAGQDARRRLGLPSEWDQQHWISTIKGVALAGHCGTAGCIAGYVAVAQLKGEPTLDWESEWRVVLPNGITPHVDAAAREALGLTKDQAYVLFHEDNTLDDLIDIGGQLLAGVEHVRRNRDGFAGYGS